MVEQAEQLGSDGPAVPKDKANASSDTNSKGAGTSSLGLHYTPNKQTKKKPFDLADPNSSTAIGDQKGEGPACWKLRVQALFQGWNSHSVKQL